MKKNLLLLMILISICGFAFMGCQKEIPENPAQGESASGEIYYKSITDLKISPTYAPWSGWFLTTDAGVYFMEKTELTEDEEYSWEHKFYIKPYDVQAECRRLPVVLKDTYLLAYDVFTDDEQGDCLYTLVLGDEDRLEIVSYDAEGFPVKDIVITDSLCTRNDVNRMFVADEETVLLYGYERLFFIDAEGTVLQEITCPFGGFQNIVSAKDGTLYISMYDGAEGKTGLAQIHLNTRSLSEAKEIPGDGLQLSAYGEKDLFLYDAENIYSFCFETGTLTPLVNLKEANIWITGVQAIRQQGEDIAILSMRGNEGSAPVNLICLSKEKRENSEQVGAERTKIYVHAHPEELGEEMIETFNESNLKYEVVVKYYGDDLNFILASSDAPDIILTGDYGAQPMMEQGYLEDLLPYINESDIFGLEDVRQEVLDAMYYGDSIYILPYVYSVNALSLKASQVSPGMGWTIEEFITWLEEHPDVVSNCITSWESVFAICMEGGWDTFVNLEEGKCYFDGEEFKTLLSRIQSLKIEKDTSLWLPDMTDLSDKTVITQKYVYTGQGVAGDSYIYGEEATLKGYPTKDGRPLTLMSLRGLGILSTSKNKEGAFEFLEHAFCFMPEYDGGNLYVNKDSFEKGMADVDNIMVGRTEEGEPINATEQEKAIVREALENAKSRHKAVSEILLIVYEEVGAYYNGQKGLDETCAVIQSRVQLYLDEQK